MDCDSFGNDHFDPTNDVGFNQSSEETNNECDNQSDQEVRFIADISFIQIVFKIT